MFFYIRKFYFALDKLYIVYRVTVDKLRKSNVSFTFSCFHVLELKTDIYQQLLLNLYINADHSEIKDSKITIFEQLLHV